MGIAHRVKVKGEAVAVAAVKAARGWDEVKAKVKVEIGAKVARATSKTEAPLRRRHPFLPDLASPVRRQPQNPCPATASGNDACGYIVAGTCHSHRKMLDSIRLPAPSNHQIQEYAHHERP
nr:hypothetical protein [Desulfonatronum sp. SC1]